MNDSAANLTRPRRINCFHFTGLGWVRSNHITPYWRQKVVPEGRMAEEWVEEGAWGRQDLGPSRWRGGRGWGTAHVGEAGGEVHAA